MENEIARIISQAKESMREMLKSVYSYNSYFAKNKEDEKLLEKIIFAISVIDRKFFYEGKEAYNDNALLIGLGQTISQPSTVARMLLLAELEEGDDVLEIGSGSGWNASLIAFLVYPGNAVSVEKFASLKEKAEDNLSNLRSFFSLKKPHDFNKISKINFYAENIFEKKKSWKKEYDKIIVTAGIVSEEQEKEIKNLAENLLNEYGILVCPRVSGSIIILRKKGKKLIREETEEEYVFVPLLES